MQAMHCDILAKHLHPTLPKPSNTVTCAREQVFGLPSPWFGKMLVAFPPYGRRRTSADSRKKEFLLHSGGGASRLAPSTEASSRTRLRGFTRQRKAARSDPARSAHGPLQHQRSHSEPPRRTARNKQVTPYVKRRTKIPIIGKQQTPPLTRRQKP